MRLKERRQGEADGDGDSSGGEFGCRDDAGDRARGWRDAVRAEGRTERREVGDTRSPGTLVCSLLSRWPLLSGETVPWAVPSASAAGSPGQPKVRCRVWVVQASAPSSSKGTAVSPAARRRERDKGSLGSGWARRPVCQALASYPTSPWVPRRRESNLQNRAAA